MITPREAWRLDSNGLNGVFDSYFSSSFSFIILFKLTVKINSMTVGGVLLQPTLI